MRDPIIHQLLTQIQYLSKQLREQLGNSRHDIERLEVELFMLKNENAQLKSKQSNSNIKQRLTIHGDLSVRSLTEKNHRKRSHSNSIEK